MQKRVKNRDHFNTTLIYGHYTTMPVGQNRSDIHPGMRVRIVEKQNQRSGKLTEGNVYRILTSSPHHPHGIKVELKDGTIGRVKEILDDPASAIDG